jgi:hypothetical protein
MGFIACYKAISPVQHGVRINSISPEDPVDIHGPETKRQVHHTFEIFQTSWLHQTTIRRQLIRTWFFIRAAVSGVFDLPFPFS